MGYPGDQGSSSSSELSRLAHYPGWLCQVPTRHAQLTGGIISPAIETVGSQPTRVHFTGDEPGIGSTAAYQGGRLYYAVPNWSLSSAPVGIEPQQYA